MSNEIKDILARLADHEARIALLEGVLARNTKPMRKVKRVSTSSENYSGPTGGVRFIFSKGFFKEKMALSAVRERLAKEGYHYSRQAVHEALKTLSRPSGLLVVLKEGRNKVYVERK